MCTVCIEESATVRAQFFDDFLGSHWPLRDGLIGHRVHHRLTLRIHHGFAVRHSCYLHWLYQLGGVVRFEVLHYSLRDEHQGTQNTGWQQYPQIAADKIDPKIANRLRLATSDAADECNRQCD